MAGYSGRSVVQKLGIKPGFRIFVDSAPVSYAAMVGDLPAGIALVARLKGPLDMVHVFATRAIDVRKKLPACRDAVAPDGMVWMSWPKKSSGVVSDVSEDMIRDAALSLGLVDIKVCAIDETWSGLKLVIPRDLRKAIASPRRSK